MPRSSPEPLGVQRIGLAVALLGLAGAGLILNLYWLRTLTSVFLIASIAQSINIIAGFTGYPAFGQVVFFGLGAYAAAVATTTLKAPLVAGPILAAAVCTAFVLGCGPNLLRLKGHYFAIATLGLNEATKAVVNNWTALTGGGSGLSLPLPPGSASSNALVFYFTFLALMLISTGGVWLFGRTRFGYACRAIRADEQGAASAGINTTFCKTGAWLLSALVAGQAGSFYAYWQNYIDPPTVFDMDISVKGFVIFLLGGPGGTFGPILAAFLLELASTFAWSHLLTFHLGMMGIIIMLTVLYLPRGFSEFLRGCAATFRWPSSVGARSRKA